MRQRLGWTVLVVGMSLSLAGCAWSPMGGAFAATLSTLISVILLASTTVATTSCSSCLSVCLSFVPEQDEGPTQVGPCLGAPREPLDVPDVPDAGSTEDAPDAEDETIEPKDQDAARAQVLERLLANGTLSADILDRIKTVDRIKEDA